MPKIGPTYKRRSLLVSAITVSAVFFIIGPAVSDALIKYGIDIFSPSMREDFAILMAGAISFPTGAIFESLPVSRYWMAINGAFWGVIGYLFSAIIAHFMNKRRTERS